MTVQDLIDELSTLDPGQRVPVSLALSYLDVDHSYVEAALSQWFQIAEMFGRTWNPEVEHFHRELQRVL